MNLDYTFFTLLLTKNTFPNHFFYAGIIRFFNKKTSRLTRLNNPFSAPLILVYALLFYLRLSILKSSSAEIKNFNRMPAPLNAHLIFGATHQSAPIFHFGKHAKIPNR